MVLRPLVKGVDTGLYVVAGTPFLYIPQHKMLVMADLHLGFEEAASRGLTYSLRGSSSYAGVFLPRIQLRRAIEYLVKASSVLDIDRVVVNGDLKHAFDRLLRQERDEVVEFVTWLREKGIREVEVVRGNHDNYLKPVLRRLNVELVNSIEVTAGSRRILIVHGHEDVDVAGRDIVVIGHEHPSLKCLGSYRFPVFMKIPLETGGLLVVMPATGPYHPGINVSLNRDDYLSPIVRKHALLEKTGLITWVNLGSVDQATSRLMDSTSATELLDIDRYVEDNVEVAVVEFRDIETAHILCSFE